VHPPSFPFYARRYRESSAMRDLQEDLVEGGQGLVDVSLRVASDT